MTDNVPLSVTKRRERNVSRKWKNSIIASAFTARAWDYPLAQSVERWTPLPEVPGSNLGTGTLDESVSVNIGARLIVRSGIASLANIFTSF